MLVQVCVGVGSVCVWKRKRVCVCGCESPCACVSFYLCLCGTLVRVCVRVLAWGILRVSPAGTQFAVFIIPEPPKPADV